MTRRFDPRDVLDRQLGRVTMYRLVTIVLVLLALVMLVFTAAGTFTDPFTVEAELLTLTVLVVSAVLSSRLIGLALKVRAHTESSVITGLLLFFIFWPSTQAGDLAWLAAAAVLASASKFAIAWRGRHVVNPAAAGALLVVIAQQWAGRDAPINPTWWVAAEKLFPFVVVGALLVLWRTRRLDVGGLFAVVAYVLCVWGFVQGFGAPVGQTLETVLYSFPIVFMAGFMVSEPLTLPPRRVQQLVVAVVVAVCFACGPVLSILDRTAPQIGVVSLGSPEVALLVGNLVAFGFARRRGLTLRLERARQVSPETHELTFRARPPVAFTPGQYVELTLPHSGMDARGARRAFSISSPPGPDGLVSVALRVPPRSSSFKKALLALQPGQTVHGTGVGGDFVWPADPRVPLLLVAGGIGITPFLSQLRHDTGRDVVLVYGAASADEIPFADELDGVRVVLVCPERPASLPESWTYVAASVLSGRVIADAVPDLGQRRAYVSGPPAMVNAVRTDLKRRCVSVTTDYFSGY